MKYITTILLLSILLLYSCSPGNNTKQLNEEVTIADESFKTFDTIVPFAGTWVSEDYYKCLIETKSAKKAQEITDANAIVIPNRTLQTTNMIYGFHEGSENIFVVKNGNNYEFWSKPADEMFYDIQIISENKIKIGKIDFMKLSDKTESDTDDMVLNGIGDILFGGTYTSDGNNIIEFKPDGRVIGFDDFLYYTPILDYYDMAMDIDLINLMKIDEKGSQNFGYKFDRDTLLIYDLNCLEYEEIENKYCAKVDFGELKYKLWKK
ncbi:hypothetical protein FACS189434_00910 [Bacteroidia bacterium]|nr:hypothetical protein FACS189434_00910 [Bacteroidia bacterium]